MWDLIVSVPDHCLSSYFTLCRIDTKLFCLTVVIASLTDKYFTV